MAHRLFLSSVSITDDDKLTSRFLQGMFSFYPSLSYIISRITSFRDGGISVPVHRLICCVIRQNYYYPKNVDFIRRKNNFFLRLNDGIICENMCVADTSNKIKNIIRKTNNDKRIPNRIQPTSKVLKIQPQQPT